MQLLAETALAVRRTVEILRAAPHSLKDALRACSSLHPLLEEWGRTVSKKVDAMEALLEDASPNGKADLGYWNSSALRKRVGDDPFFDEPTALRVLAILREVADLWNAGKVSRIALLNWFEARRHQIRADGSIRDRLARLPILPASGTPAGTITSDVLEFLAGLVDGDLVAQQR